MSIVNTLSLESNIQLKHSNYVAFSHFHGFAVNNIGSFQPVICSLLSMMYWICPKLRRADLSSTMNLLI